MSTVKTRLTVLVSLASILVFGSPALGADEYTAYVGSVSWRNQGACVYTSDGNPWCSDDFTGPSATCLTTPPYVWIENPPLCLNGDGTLALYYNSSTMEHNSAGLPNYDQYGQWLDVRNADFIVNFQTGAPPQGYSYSIIIATPADEDLVNLSVGTPSDVNWPTMLVEDEYHEIEEDKFCPLIFKSLSALGIEGYSSLGLKLHVDQWGHCTPYYWASPPDGVLPSDDEHWVQFGKAITQIDTCSHFDIFFTVSSVGPAPPMPCECDLNHDGKCDMLDWLLFGDDWGRINCPICP